MHPSIRTRSTRVALLLATACSSTLACTPIKAPSSGAKQDSTAAEHDGSHAQTMDPPSQPSAAGEEDAAPNAGTGGVQAREKDDPASPKTDPTPPKGGASEPVGGTGGSSASAAGSGGAREPTDVIPERSREPLPLQQTEIAPETADQEALEQLTDWNALPVFGSDRSRQASSQDRGRGVENDPAIFRSLLGDGERDENNFVCRSADADLGPIGIPYLYDEMDRCAEKYVHGVVLARFEGSGRMRRLLLTTADLNMTGLVLMNEMLRVYVDDNPRAIVQVRLDQVVTGAAGEIFATPFGSIARNSIAWYYPIVFSSKLIVALDYLRSDYFYEVDAALDATQRNRVAPAHRLSQRDAAHARLANATPLPAAASTLRTETFMLGAGGQNQVELTGPATIEELRLRVAKDKLTNLSAVRVTARWDGASQPAIDVPILALFDAMRTPVAGSDLALTSATDGDDQLLSLRLPMPFKTAASWTLSNTAADSFPFTLEWIGEAQLPEGEFGHLSVQYNEPMLPPMQIAQTVAQVSGGRGRMVGLCGDLAGHSETAAFGETYADPLNLVGYDLRMETDGQVALESLSTDTYADNSFYFIDSPKSTPFAQNWNRVEMTSAKPPGQVSFCRWHVLGNAIDFQNDLKFTRNAARRDLSIVELHRTVAYLYLP